MTPDENREDALLRAAEKYSFGGRIDQRTVSGPVFEWGRGSVVRDVTGREFLDFNSGQACAALGHNHPKITAAIRQACEDLLHAHSSYFNVKEIELAARLGELFPDPLCKSLFGESGADATELAMLIARMFTGGEDIFSPHTSYHGLSGSARSVTFAGWRRGHGELPGHGHAILAPYCYRCPIGATFPDCKLGCVKASFELIDAQSTTQPAAVITEPLFSAGGVIDPPRGWLSRVAEECHARDMLLIVDENQTGLGKLGTMFGFERDEVVPDLVTLAKHFGGGVGISSVTTRPEIERAVSKAGLTVTRSHSNDPLLCAAGLASLDVVEEEDVPATAVKLGEHMLEFLTSLADRFDCIGDIRGHGMIVGIELVKDRESREPAFELGRKIGAWCVANDLLFSLRRGGSVLRFIPPASTTSAQLDQGMETLARAFEEVVPA